MRKQKYLDDLMTEMSQIKEENNQIEININMFTQLYLKVEAENSILKAQIAELSHRLQFLKDIINCRNAATTTNDEQTIWSLLGVQNYSEFIHLFC